MRRLTAPTVDGHTRYVLRSGTAGVGAWHSDLHDVRTRLRAAAKDGVDELLVQLGPGLSERVVVARARVSGARQHIVTLYAEGIFYSRWNFGTGEVHVQLRAKSLWSYGYELAVGFALGLCSRLAGHGVTLLGDAAARGWRLTGLELCSDYTGWKWDRADAYSVTRFQKGSVIAKTSDTQVAETVQFGSRESRVSLVLYDKTRQILASHHAAEAATYHPAWLAGGWLGPQEEVVRVEFRLTDAALVFVDPDGVVYDLRDPATLCDAEVSEKLWAYLTRTYRLIHVGERTRRTNCPTQARWKVVQSASEVDDDPEWRQARAVQQGVLEERLEKLASQAVGKLATYAAYHGHVPTSRRGWHEILELALADHADGFVRERRSTSAISTVLQAYGLLGPEIDERKEHLERWSTMLKTDFEEVELPRAEVGFLAPVTAGQLTEPP